MTPTFALDLADRETGCRSQSDPPHAGDRPTRPPTRASNRGRYRLRKGRPLLTVAFALSLLAWVPVSARAEVLGDLSVDSPLLGRPLTYAVYRPNTEGRLPAVMLLHGFGGGRGDWLGAGALQATVEQLLASGDIRPMVFILPDAGNSWYVDNRDPGGLGPVASALLEDLLPVAEARHGALGTRDGRAVAGLSMGGYGALRLATHHPDLFVAAVSLSGAIFADVPVAGPHGFSDAQIGLFAGAFGTPLDAERFNRLGVLAPIATLRQRPDSPHLLLMVGDDDFFGLWRGAFDVFEAYRQADLPIELRVRDGGHTWARWSADLPDALRFIAAAMVARSESAPR